MRGPRAALPVVLAALPWVALHHGVTYAYSGKWGPPNADPAAFDYPGSGFDATNLTGRYNHESAWALVRYAVLLLVGGGGFLLVCPTLLLAVLAPFLLPRRLREGPVLWPACGFAVGTWAVFSVLSNNYSGSCCSVRWFVPLLLPGYYALALLVRERPGWRGDFLLLAGWGLALGLYLGWRGPWKIVGEKGPELFDCPVEYLLVAGCLASWALYRGWRLVRWMGALRSSP